MWATTCDCPLLFLRGNCTFYPRDSPLICLSLSTNLMRPVCQAWESEKKRSPSHKPSMWSHPETLSRQGVWVVRETYEWAEDKNEKTEEGRVCHETFHSYFPSASCPHLLCFSSGHPSFNSVSLFPLVASCHPQMNSMNSVSSSEDIKPPPGLQNMGNINYQCTSPGGMSKHICAICGDRSSGNVRGGRRRKGKYIHTQITEGNIKDDTLLACICWKGVLCIRVQQSIGHDTSN